MSKNQLMFDSKDVAKDMLELTCAKMVHEIKNPLTLISSTLQLVEHEMPGVLENKYWKKINSELNHLNALLNDINSISSAKRTSFEPIDLGELFYEICENFIPFCMKSGVELTVDVPDDIINISSDEIKLTEAFTNLIKNAIEATKMGGKVWVTLIKRADMAEIQIEDDGCGISPEMQSEIFRPFVTYKPTGTGLGLPIVASIIENLNGSIQLESEVGVGTKFIVYLPLDDDE